MTSDKFTYSSSHPSGAEAERLATGFGNKLTAARTRAGLNKADLGRAAGISASTISALERGRQRPRWTTLQTLANALHPHNPTAAHALAHHLADAAGPSLAGAPDLPTSLARELVVEVVLRTAHALGINLNDEHVRAIAVEQIRAATRKPEHQRPSIDTNTSHSGTTP